MQEEGHHSVRISGTRAHPLSENVSSAAGCPSPIPAVSLLWEVRAWSEGCTQVAMGGTHGPPSHSWDAMRLPRPAGRRALWELLHRRLPGPAQSAAGLPTHELCRAFLFTPLDRGQRPLTQMRPTAAKMTLRGGDSWHPGQGDDPWPVLGVSGLPSGPHSGGESSSDGRPRRSRLRQALLHILGTGVPVRAGCTYGTLSKFKFGPSYKN